MSGVEMLAIGAAVGLVIHYVGKVATQVLWFTISSLWHKIRCIPPDKKEIMGFFEEAHQSAVEAGETLNAIGMHGTDSDMKDRVKRLQFFVEEVDEFCTDVEEQNWDEKYWASSACKKKIKYIQKLKGEIDTETEELKTKHRLEQSRQAVGHQLEQALHAVCVTDGTVTAQRLDVQDATHDNDGAFFQQVLDVVRKQSSRRRRISGEGADFPAAGGAPAPVNNDRESGVEYHLVTPGFRGEPAQAVVDQNGPAYDHATNGPWTVVAGPDEPIYDYATNGRLILIEYAEGHVYWCATQRLQAELEALSKEGNSRPPSMFGKLFGGIASLFRRSPKVSPKVDRSQGGSHPTQRRRHPSQSGHHSSQSDTAK